MDSASLQRLRHALTPADYGIGALLCVAYVALLALTDQMGFTRDESFYFHAAREYGGWFTALARAFEEGQLWVAFTQPVIDDHWAYNPEHPPLVKTTFALSQLWFTDLLGPSLAMRLPAMLFAGWLIAMLYTFTVEVSGSRFAGLLAATSFALLPRWFFHAHLTCFDVPVTAIWFSVMYAYWKSLDSTPWAWATGVAWGIALLTKLNAFFIPFVLLAHWGLLNLPKFRFEAGGRVRAPNVPFALFTMALVGPVLFVAGWPRHWFDTFDRIGWYLNFHLQHEHYYVLYFGQSLFEPPFPVSFPFVMTATTTPVMFLAAFAFGAGLLLSRWGASLRAGLAGRRPAALLRGEVEHGDTLGTGLFIALNILVPFLIIARPSTPVFGGVKHWFPALPYMALVAGVGLAWAADRVAPAGTLQRTVARGLVAIGLLVPIVTATAANHPYGTAYYNALVGGTVGAAERDGMRQFWGYAARGGLDWLNENAEEGARIHTQNTTQGAWDMYRAEGLVRDDLRIVWDVRRADYMLFHHQKSFAPLLYNLWSEFGTTSPAHVVTLDGVPMLSIYRRQESPEEAGAAGSVATEAATTILRRPSLCAHARHDAARASKRPGRFRRQRLRGWSRGERRRQRRTSAVRRGRRQRTGKRRRRALSARVKATPHAKSTPRAP